MLLVKITNSCTMNCSHCMENATPDGKHMSMDTFLKTLDCIKRLEMPAICVSGGEPTDHPQYIDMMKLAVQRLTVIVLSNGLWYETDRRTQLLSLGVSYQVINDERYYPTKVVIDHPDVLYDDHLIAPLSPFGRALENNLEYSRMSPMCFNLRSITRSYGDIWYGIMGLRMRGKMCTPSVRVDGSIVAGESSSCHSIGTVEDSFETLTENLLNMKCNKCGLFDQLPEEYRRAVYG